MCGIAGYFGTALIAPERVAAAMDALHHRGPDHAAAYAFSNTPSRRVQLAYSRLSIIDLEERSNQPFRIGSHVMVYNGELYNYVELRHRLECAGHSFSTRSDTEVMLRTLLEFGPDGLELCEGMWALALFNEADGSLLLSRDRFGQKPLFVHRGDDGWYFGSEIKAIHALLGHRLPVNREHLYRYLVNGYRALYKSSVTFFKGIENFSPATYRILSQEGEPRDKKFWQPQPTVDLGMSREEAVAGVRDRLIASVRMCLRADMPIAFCLSGGIDSNALVATAKRVLGYDVHGFTITNDDERYEEQEMVDCAVDALQVRHTAIGIRPDAFLENLRQLVRQHDAPVYTITYYAHWLLMRSIAEHGYRISVSGTAADELFTGYYDHHLFYLAAVHGQAEDFETAVAAWRQHIKPLVRNPLLQEPCAFVQEPDAREHLYLDAQKFSEFLHSGWQEPFEEQQYAGDVLRNRMLNELLHEVVPPILHEDDHNAMAFSIENRSPFLDTELCAFASRIPTRHLIRDGFGKSVLRDAMRGIVPDAILDNRRKVGFNAPIFSFLDVSRQEVRATILEDSPIFDHVDRSAIDGLIRKAHLPNSQSKFLFYFLSSKFFLEECQ